MIFSANQIGPKLRILTLSIKVGLISVDLYIFHVPIKNKLDNIVIGFISIKISEKIRKNIQ